jgi:hypothetical protein
VKEKPTSPRRRLMGLLPSVCYYVLFNAVAVQQFPSKNGISCDARDQNVRISLKRKHWVDNPLTFETHELTNVILCNELRKCELLNKTFCVLLIDLVILDDSDKVFEHCHSPGFKIHLSGWCLVFVHVILLKIHDYAVG